MATNQQTPEAISEGATKQLASFAEKNLRAADRSELLAPVPSLIERGGVYVIAGAVVLTLLLLYFGKVHVVVNAKGVIAPEGDVRPVQALQSGVVKAVLARAGDRLAAGAPLINLDISESGIDLALQKRKQQLDSNQLQALRDTVVQLGRILGAPQTALESISGSSIVSEAAPAVDALQNATMKLEAAKRDLALLPERTHLQTRQIELIRQRSDLLQKNQTTSAGFLRVEEEALDEKRKQLASYRGLAKNKLISPIELSGEEEKFRAAESGQMSLRQQYDDHEVEIANQKLNYSEGASKLQNMEVDTNSAFRAAQLNYQQSLSSLRQTRDLLGVKVQEMDSNLEAARKKIEQGERQISLASISMPVAGIVAELKTKNAGELVGAGSVVATIVPEGVPLVVNAEVPNKDIGFVKPGLEAQVKIDAYPYEQFGTVSAVVETVLPALGGNNFPITLRLVHDRLKVKSSEILLFPGLTVQADLLTTKQRLLELVMASGSDAKKDAAK
jgi:hemolysin D